MADTTDFRTKAEILSELWMDYRDDEEFQDFIEYSDLGLPLAYAISNGIVEASPMAERFVEETFSLLLSALEVTDTGFNSLQELLELPPEPTVE